MDSSLETAKMFAAFDELWASSWSLLLIMGPSSAFPLPLVTPPIAESAPVLSTVPVVVSVTFAAADLALTADSSSQSREGSSLA